MSKIEEMVTKLAEECREAKLNFVIAVEDDGIHDMTSIHGKTPLRGVANELKKLRN